MNVCQLWNKFMLCEIGIYLFGLFIFAKLPDNSKRLAKNSLTTISFSSEDPPKEFGDNVWLRCDMNHVKIINIMEKMIP